MKKAATLITEKSTLILCLMTLFFAYLYQLEQHNLLYHLGDEFGYWANAAYLYGYNWSGIASHNMYYSFGYSIILAPLFLIKNFEIRYITALIINILFEIISFLLMAKIAKTVFYHLSLKTIFIISMCVTLYIGNVFFSKTTLCESALYCTYVCITYLIMRISIYGQWKHYIILGLLTPYIFAIHMRSLGVVLSVLLFLAIEFRITKADRKKILISFFLIAVLLVLALIYKERLLYSLYAVSDSVNSNDLAYGNDFSGQVGRLQVLFSSDGIISLFTSIIGKVYYLLSASFLITAWAIIWIIKQNIIIYNKNTIKFLTNAQSKFAFYLLTSCIFTIGISSIFAIETSDRLDTLLYGRYNEFIIGPFLLIGCCYLITKKLNILKKWLWIVIIYLLCTFCVMHIFSQSENPYIIETSVVGVAFLSYNGERFVYDKWEVVISLKVIIISTIMLLLLNQNNKKLKICTFLSVAVIWFYGGNWLLNFQLNTKNSYYTNKNLSDYLNSNSIDEITFLTNEYYSYFDYYRADILQYMNPSLFISCKDINNTSLDNENIFFIKKGCFNNTFDNFYCVATSDDFELYIKKY